MPENTVLKEKIETKRRRENYKRIGDYIRLVDERNKGLEDLPLVGLSIAKKFIPSIANTFGTDMSTYKIIRRNQFAYSGVTSRNGDKITIALFQDYEKALISQAYTPFEIVDSNSLLPEYLMMWFRRPEFDRYARFKSHGSAREIFDWEELCDTLIPVPPIEKQREIVKEYKVIEDRIELNNQMIQKLEETGQAIYKHWFVKGIDLENLPEGWEIITLKDFCVEMKSGGTPNRMKNSYWNSNDIPWIKTGEIKNNILIRSEEHISKEGFNNSSAKLLPKDAVLMSMYGVNAGEIGILKFEATTNQACCGMICENVEQSSYLYYHLLHHQAFIASQAIGGAQENLSKDFIEKIEILKPSKEILHRPHLKTIIANKEIYTIQNQKLEELKELSLTRIVTI